MYLFCLTLLIGRCYFGSARTHTSGFHIAVISLGTCVPYFFFFCPWVSLFFFRTAYHSALSKSESMPNDSGRGRKHALRTYSSFFPPPTLCVCPPDFFFFVQVPTPHITPSQLEPYVYCSPHGRCALSQFVRCIAVLPPFVPTLVSGLINQASLLFSAPAGR